MSEIKNEDNSPPAISPKLKEEIYLNCSECSSLMEIISIDEENNFIEFNCLCKENNHNKNKNIIVLKKNIRKIEKNIIKVK